MTAIINNGSDLALIDPDLDRLSRGLSGILCKGVHHLS
jgi:hypothetical protein